ncbi:hypothetical protein [Morganella phage IME1369_02]|nr:hypothetical protein [Morganella phage IME1369_02]
MGDVMEKSRIHSLNLYIGKNIRRARKEAGISAEELGFRIGSSQQIISRYETGKVHIKAATLIVIAEVLDIPLSKLLPDKYV